MLKLKLSVYNVFKRLNYQYYIVFKMIKDRKDIAKKCVFLCIVFVFGSKPTVLRNKTGFILYSLNSPPLNSQVKNKT